MNAILRELGDIVNAGFLGTFLTALMLGMVASGDGQEFTRIFFRRRCYKKESERHAKPQVESQHLVGGCVWQSDCARVKGSRHGLVDVWPAHSRFEFLPPECVENGSGACGVACTYTEEVKAGTVQEWIEGYSDAVVDILAEGEDTLSEIKTVRKLQ